MLEANLKKKKKKKKLYLCPQTTWNYACLQLFMTDKKQPDSAALDWDRNIKHPMQPNQKKK